MGREWVARWPGLAAVLLVAACGSAHPRSLRSYRPDVLADRGLCEDAVRRYERNNAFSAIEAEPAVGEARGWRRLHDEKVLRCMTSLSQWQAACLARAISTTAARSCSRYDEMR